MSNKTVRCEAPGCKNTTQFRSRAWTKSWMLVWVENGRGVGRSYQVCSELCAKIVKQQETSRKLTYKRQREVCDETGSRP
jgi:hypothetical protein